jgi:CheY-like chemotaxis protein
VTHILLVEDEGPKRENIRSLLKQMALLDGVYEARSVGSAVRALRNRRYDLVILDMSLPTFDIEADASGGRPQGFGGVEVLRYMDRFKIETPSIVLTAFEAFGEGGKELDLRSLEETVRRDHPRTFADLVFYNSMFSTWRDDLRQKIEKALRR